MIQKILFGSPGTGKSHKVDREIIPVELGIDRAKTPENIIKTVFHPEYSYGDFMGKLVPMTRTGKVDYTYYEGHFLRALAQAYKNLIVGHNKQGSKIDREADDIVADNVVLVIDEINRGNSSAIFGAVFQLLDRDDKGWSNYEINVNQIDFVTLLTLIGTSFSYDENGKIDKYELKPYHDSVKLKTFQEKIAFLNFNLANRTIKIPPNLSIIATMNTSDSSIYYMDSAFKRRWDWEFIDVDGKSVKAEGIAFRNRAEWENFVRKLNVFIKRNHKYIRGIEDKQVGHWFIKDNLISKSILQNKLMFFIWDNVFSRDKKPLIELMFQKDSKEHEQLITFGDFARQVDLFIRKINEIS